MKQKYKWENVEIIGVLMQIMQTGGFESQIELKRFTFNFSFVLRGIFVIPRCSKYA